MACPKSDLGEAVGPCAKNISSPVRAAVAGTDEVREDPGADRFGGVEVELLHDGSRAADSADHHVALQQHPATAPMPRA